MYRSLYWNCEEQRSKPNLWTVTLKFVQKESAWLLVPEVWSSSFSGLGLSPEINSNLTNISSYSNNDPHINWVLILNTSIYWAVTVFQECIFISFNLYNNSMRWLLLLSLRWVDVAVDSRRESDADVLCTGLWETTLEVFKVRLEIQWLIEKAAAYIWFISK